MTNLERDVLRSPHDLALPLLQGCKLTCSSCDDNEARHLYSCTAMVHCAGLVEALCLPVNEMGCMQLHVFLQHGKSHYTPVHTFTDTCQAFACKVNCSEVSAISLSNTVWPNVVCAILFLQRFFL